MKKSPLSHTVIWVNLIFFPSRFKNKYSTIFRPLAKVPLFRPHKTYPRIVAVESLHQDVQYPLAVELFLVQQKLNDDLYQARFGYRAYDQIQIGHGRNLRLHVRLEMTSTFKCLFTRGTSSREGGYLFIRLVCLNICGRGYSVKRGSRVSLYTVCLICLR